MMKYELQNSVTANSKGSGINHDQITIEALYVNQCKFVTTLLKRAKAEYYQTKVMECKKDQKALVRVLNELMHRNN